MTDTETVDTDTPIVPAIATPPWPLEEYMEPDYIWADVVRDLADHTVDDPPHTTPEDIRFDLSVHDGPWIDQRLIDEAVAYQRLPGDDDQDSEQDEDQDTDDDRELSVTP